MKIILPKNLIAVWLCSSLILSVNTAFAQIEVQPTGTIFTPESLITNIFLGDGIEVTNITYEGDDLAVGYFTSGTNNVGIDRGIVLSSGFAADVTGSEPGITTGATTGASGNQYLEGITDAATVNDVSLYSITFVPTSDTLRFKYTFASEEYPGFACSNFNDVFGFFIYGPGINGPHPNNSENIALIPELADPTGLTFTDIPVAINNVNDAGANPPLCNYDYGDYYNNNAGSTTMIHGAFLDVFIAQAIVTPCLEYTIVLAIADGGDTAFDSAVFLEAKSFGTGAINVETQTVSLDGTLTESCTEGALSFAVASPVEDDLIFDYTIFGTAENGVDYSFLPDDLFIPAGDSVVSVPVTAFDDGILEGIETIGIDIQVDPCNRDTFYFYIRDNDIVPMDLGPDTTVCLTQPVQLYGEPPITLPPPPTFSNETDMAIVTINDNDPPVPPPPPTCSGVNVFGVQPVELGPGVIQSVCINVDHIWISDVDIFLVSPGGQFLELTTDNGASGDDYTETCFTPDATDPITFGQVGAPASAAPFTGNFQPEGNWEDLYDGDNPTNGTWKLLLKDDTGGLNGTLLGWTITFNPSYQIEDYDWQPTDGLSCTNCPDPIATPDSTTTYYLTATDTYGCPVSDSITITILDVLPAPEVICSDITSNSIDFIWDDIPGSTGYEVSIDGGPWMLASPGPLNQYIDNLALNTDVTIMVRALSFCDGLIDTLTCTTNNCTPPSLIVDSFTEVSCAGAGDGTISVSADGNFPPFEFTLGAVTNSTGVFDNLPGGTYTVVLTDVGGCNTSQNIDIFEPPFMETTAIPLTDANCNGGNEGSATFEVNGGSQPYTFMWSNGTVDSIASGLVVGDYFITITDASGCSVVDSVIVDQPESLILTPISTAVSCNGQANGVASVSVAGGIEPYGYLWNTGATTDAIANLTGGTYSVVVTDAQGCFEEIIIPVFEDSPLELTGSTVSALCFGDANGSATVVATGGTTPYTYLWDDLAGQTTDVASDLTENEYNVIVTDSFGCTATLLLMVEGPALLQTATVDVNNTSCFGVDDGSISISASGGVYPYTYAWNDNVMITDSTRTDLIAINYSITITDANGCSQVVTATIDSPEAIAITFDQNNVSCNGGNTGSATAQPLGGTAPYQYQWDAAAGNQTIQTAIDLSIGFYTVVVTDANGCTNSEVVEITESSAIGLTISGDNILCFGNNTGAIQLDVTGGNAPYTFSWTGPGTYNSTLEDIDDLYVGTYEVLVTDASGCTSTTQLAITEPATGIMSTMSDMDTICFGSSNGVATVSVGGGTGPFGYLWPDGSTTSTVNNLPEGTHFVTITDNGGCTYIDTAYIEALGQINVQLSQTSASCFNGNDGTATIDAITYNNTAADLTDFNIAWSTGDNGAAISNAIGGQNYSVVVTDALGCTGSANIIIDNPAEIGSIVQGFENASCFGNNDGTATVNGAGGTTPYSFLWDANASGQTTATATDLTSGIYSVIITDANGCSTSIEVEIEQPDPISVNHSTDAVLCPGDANGSADPTVTGGTAPYTYLWSNGSTEPNLENVGAGNYSLTITDANGCIDSSGTFVNSPPALSSNITTEPTSCHDSQDGSIHIEVIGGTPPFRYSLDGEDYNGSLIQLGLTGGIYTVYIRDVNGCVFETETEVQSPPPISLEAGWLDGGLFDKDDPSIEVGDSVRLALEYENQQGAVTVTWLPPYEPSLVCHGNPLSILDCNLPWVFITNTTTFDVHIMDENGCETRDEVTVTITKNRPVHIASAFSPNGDGNNDLLMVHGRPGTKVLSFRVYDRWGEQLYQANDFDVNDEQTGWNGYFGSDAMNPGVYIWTIEVEHIDGDREGLSGQTTIIR